MIQQISISCNIIFLFRSISHLNASCRLATAFVELVSVYYHEEGRRFKTLVEKKNFTYAELGVRYCFKVRPQVSSSLKRESVPFIPPSFGLYSLQLICKTNIIQDWGNVEWSALTRPTKLILGFLCLLC